MPKRKADIAIGERAYSEVLRLFGSVSKAAVAIGCTRGLINDWHWGTSPGAMYLARLHQLGADVIWILTGVKSDGN